MHDIQDIMKIFEMFYNGMKDDVQYEGENKCKYLLICLELIAMFDSFHENYLDDLEKYKTLAWVKDLLQID